MIAPLRDAKGRRIIRAFPVSPLATCQMEMAREEGRAWTRRQFDREQTGYAEPNSAPLPGDIGGRRALPVFED